MHIRLDQDSWTVADTDRVDLVLADLSDRAAATGRLVTRLTIGDRVITDRDLVPDLLAEPVGRVGPIHASTQSVEDLLRASLIPAGHYARHLVRTGATIGRQLRVAPDALAALDRWLGELADYVEWATNAGAAGVLPAATVHEWLSWVTALLAARDAADVLRLADVLEYELLPRLAALAAASASEPPAPAGPGGPEAGARAVKNSDALPIYSVQGIPSEGTTRPPGDRGDRQPTSDRCLQEERSVHHGTRY